MKYYLTILLIFFPILLFSNYIYDPYNFTRTISEPVQWSPEQGVYSNTVYLNISSQYGKIYYIINGTLADTEPAEFTKEIVLQGMPGSIVNYNILVILEKISGNVELYSRTYRIDKTSTYNKNYIEKTDYFKEKVNYEKDKVKIIYDFNSLNYNVSSANREFIFPQKIKENETTSYNLELNGEIAKNSLYLVSCTYAKDDKIYSEIKSYQLNLVKPKPPSFGSLFWGQTYRQSYKVRIKPFRPDDKVYYWLREWKSSDLIFGPPSQEKIERWEEYNDPIELKSEYGKNGIMGIAGFSMNKSGEYSDIAGPYYFKLDDVDNKLEQVFNNENKESLEELIKKKIYINNREYRQEKLVVSGKAVIRFTDFAPDDKFYFTFTSLNSEGKSDLIPCDGEYTFVNDFKRPVDFHLFLTNGEKICEFSINSISMILPVMKKYLGNYVDSSSDLKIDFYMPVNKVKYGISEDINKFLIVNQQSDDFSGSLNFSVKDGDEKTFKVKFAAVDKDDNLVSESEDYFFKVSKKFPNIDITSSGVNFELPHNDRQILKLIPPPQKGKIYFRFSKNNEWSLYEEPLSLYPPLYNKFSIKIYVKFVDDVGNERENKDPFELIFDTKAIYVDANKGFSGNGTESSPCNSLERAVDFAKKKNIKMIYIVSDFINVFNPIKIDSDIIIEPYKDDSAPDVVMDIKSIWRKNFMWFDVSGKGCLELRNIDFNIKAGSFFTKVNNSKSKFYKLKLLYSGVDDFCCIKDDSSKVGINSLTLNIAQNSSRFTFMDSANSFNILKNLSIKADIKDALLINLDKNNYFSLDNLESNITVKNNFIFAKLNKSDALISSIIHKQDGDYNNSILFDLESSNLFINESDFMQNGNNTFQSKVVRANSSTVKSNKSLYWVKNCVSFIGFNLENSSMDFDRSIINCENILDYSYNFRLTGSNLKINSSIIRNLNSSSAVDFVLHDSVFEGANNSIFNADIKDKSFSFWVTDKASITTVNSIYYFNKQDDNSAFIYFNNKNYDQLKPVWYSNIISTNVILLENLEKKDAENIVKDFNEKNINFTFTNEFDIDKDNFFVPKNDSPILQSGLPEYTSPIPIPPKDFLGRNRIIQGFGIDIGAIQISGNF